MDIERLKTPVTELEMAKIVDAAGDAESNDILRRMAFQLSSSRSPRCSNAQKVQLTLDQELVNLLFMESLHSAESADEEDAAIFSRAAAQLQPYVRL